MYIIQIFYICFKYNTYIFQVRCIIPRTESVVYFEDENREK